MSQHAHVAQAPIQAQQKSASASTSMSGILQRKCACGQHTIAGGECKECRQKREGMLQRATVNAAPINGVPPIVHDVLNSPGQPLDAETRAFMEPRFGQDFSQVRVHTNARAAESAQAVNALAYTVGRNVAFGTGQYVPGTSEGRSLLAHELTHVVQQQGQVPGVSAKSAMHLNAPGDVYEQEADHMAHQLVSHDAYMSHNIPVLSPTAVTATRGPRFSSIPAQPQTAFVQRQASASSVQSVPATSNPTQLTVRNLDRESLIEVMRVIQNIKPSQVASGLYTVVFQGRSINISQAQLDDLYKKTKQNIETKLKAIRVDVTSAVEGFSTQLQTNLSSPVSAAVAEGVGDIKSLARAIVSPIKAFKSAETLENLGNLSPSFLREIFPLVVTGALAYANAAQKALENKNFIEAGRLLSESEIASIKAKKIAIAYTQGLISAAELTVTGLEYTRDASIVTLHILALFATAGASAGVEGLTLGTATAANVLATVGEAGIRQASGEKVDWGAVAINVIAQLIFMRFAPQLSEGLFQAVSRIPGVPRITQVAFRKILTSLLQSELFVTFDTIVQELYQALRGQDITYDRFIQVLVDRLIDPKNLFIAVLLGAISTAATPKLGPQGIVPPGEPSVLPPPTEPTATPRRPVISSTPARPIVSGTRALATATQAKVAPEVAPGSEPRPTTAPPLRDVSTSKPIPKDLPTNVPVGQKPLPVVATAAASKQKTQQCRPGPSEDPLPIIWPSHLLPQPSTRRQLIRTGHENDDEAEGPAKEKRGRAQVELRNEIDDADAGRVPPGRVCFHDDDHQQITDNYDAHHKHPLYLGGKDEYDNLCALIHHYHEQGHTKLNNQKKLADVYRYQYGICTPVLTKHAPGQTYFILREGDPLGQSSEE